jgi:ComF family protein
MMAAGSYNRSRVSREVRGLSIPRTRAFDWSPRDGTRVCTASATHARRACGERLRALARGTLPQACALCAARAGGALVCAACAESLPRLRSACPVCALPAADAAVCGACLSRPPPFAATVAALVYAFPADRLLQQLKYGGRLAFADWAADELAAAACAALRSRAGRARPDCVAPLPLAPARQRERGFNQAREIAARVARSVDLPLLPMLERVVQGVPQAALPWARRKANVRGAFAVARGADVRDRSIALVDDVMTTGATLAEAALTLRRAGAARVECWVVARTPPPGPAR